MQDVELKSIKLQLENLNSLMMKYKKEICTFKIYILIKILMKIYYLQ